MRNNNYIIGESKNVNNVDDVTNISITYIGHDSKTKQLVFNQHFEYILYLLDKYNNESCKYINASENLYYRFNFTIYQYYDRVIDWVLEESYSNYLTKVLYSLITELINNNIILFKSNKDASKAINKIYDIIISELKSKPTPSLPMVKQFISNLRNNLGKVCFINDIIHMLQQCIYMDISKIYTSIMDCFRIIIPKNVIINSIQFNSNASNNTISSENDALTFECITTIAVLLDQLLQINDIELFDTLYNLTEVSLFIKNKLNNNIFLKNIEKVISNEYSDSCFEI